jgi:predicted double-glycine peptidase
MRSVTAAIILAGFVLVGAANQVQPTAGLRLEVPFVPQVKQGCGSAAIAMVLLWWKQHGFAAKPASVDAATIHREVYEEKEQGTTARDVSRYFEQRGFRSFGFSGTWAELVEHLEKGRPLIAAIRPPGQRQMHYVVVSGIGTDRILLHDPAVGAYRAVSREGFEKQWAASDRFTLLAVPRQ